MAEAITKTNFNFNKQKGLYKNLLSDPMQFYFDQYRRIRTNHHPRAPKLPSEEDFEKIDFNKTIDIYKDRFADASDFTFFFVGAFNADSITPLIETYLGSLPDIERKEIWISSKRVSHKVGHFWWSNHQDSKRCKR